MNPKVSVLVPIYNVEAFIERCAVSLFEQTFDNIEYIFVNDCSPDDSMIVLDNVIKRYSNKKLKIEIINNDTNQGIAEVRNILLDKAKGDYFLFVDSDDYIDKNMIAKMYEKIIAEKADIAVCDFMIEWKNVRKIFYQNISPNKSEAICSLLRMDTMPGMPNKLIKLSLIKDCDLKFCNGMNVGEDYMIMPKLFYYARKVIKIDHAFYHYIQTNSSSYTKNYNIQSIKNINYALEELTRFFSNKEDYDFYKESILQGKLRKKIEIIFNSDSKYWSELFTIFPEVKQIIDDKYLSKREKIIYFFVKNNQKASLLYYKKAYNTLFNLVQKLKGR